MNNLEFIEQLIQWVFISGIALLSLCFLVSVTPIKKPIKDIIYQCSMFLVGIQFLFLLSLFVGIGE